MADRTRTVEGVLHFLTPQQMAEEIVRLDALLADARRLLEHAGCPTDWMLPTMGRLPVAPGVTAAPAARPDQGETCVHNRDERECDLCQRHAQQLERQRRLVATLPQTREDAEALRAGHRELWRVDLPDGAYTQLPGDPPGPAALRRVQNGIVYDVQPLSGRLIPASKPRMLPGCVTTAVGVNSVDGGGHG